MRRTSSANQTAIHLSMHVMTYPDLLGKSWETCEDGVKTDFRIRLHGFALSDLEFRAGARNRETLLVTQTEGTRPVRTAWSFPVSRACAKISVRERVHY